MVQDQTSRLEGTQATDEAIRSRVDELLAGMTAAEKAGQLTQYFYFRLPTDTENPALGLEVDTQPLMVEAALGRGEAGSLLFVTNPAEINRLQRLAVEGNRLGIPVLFGFDVIHGLRTIFPVPIGMAASWDPETIERGQAVAAREARAAGIHWAFAPPPGRLARESDIAVVVAGEWQNMIGESASRSSLELPGRQLDLLQAVVEAGTPVVLLVMNGRPLDLRWAAQHVPAILEIWYPGTRGGSAVANLLFGDVSPGGKLPFTWPRTVGQVPMVYSHTRSHEPQNQERRYWDEESTPLFPFGHGLSYASFSYRNLAVHRDAIGGPDEALTVSVDVTNTGEREADEVVQLYIHQRYGSASRPVRELKGFQRISLGAGKSRALQFTLGRSELSYWNAVARDWVLDASTFDIWVGGDSTAELSTTFEVNEA
jgi:Glycosyl hydrolase family 3 C-terminal domain/Fibronectin type III-like domain/Glycosyl hydrolase family 3 N terminal domain